ncbi:MAG: hypothetical protein H2040_07835 [Euryhalocaulis sp.]|uniref:hypothetical protein n=1 Tax=Euryhalocaulis sp. TaxID=2744307 RepID=UPI0017E2A92E|nr:hypothetical protein [Euryhalocaulis sp.]MBA4801760.1 hypothetical protein [Euryhalocaulis sp.]
MIRFIATLAAALIALPAFAGTVFDVEHRNAAGAVDHTSQIKVDGGKLAMEMMSAGEEAPEGRMIFRGDRTPQEMIVMNDQERSYMVFTAEGMGSMQSQMNSVMEQALANLPPEQRAAAEAAMSGQGMGAMMGQAPASDWRFRATGKSRDVDGRQTTGYELLKDGVRQMVFWTVPASSFNGGGDLGRTFDSLNDFFEALPMIGDAAGPMYDLDAMDGRVPVQIEEIGADGAVEATTTISEGRSMDIAASVFEPDPGYTRQEMPGMAQ